MATNQRIKTRHRNIYWLVSRIYNHLINLYGNRPITRFGERFEPHVTALFFLTSDTSGFVLLTSVSRPTQLVARLTS